MHNVEIMKLHNGAMGFSERAGYITLIVYKINFQAEYHWCMVPTCELWSAAPMNVFELPFLAQGYTHETNLLLAFKLARTAMLMQLFGEVIALIENNPALIDRSAIE